MRFYFSGQRSFGNRGCEAIIRSTLDMLRDSFGAVEVLVPSDNPALDRKQWPEAESLGVIFVRSYAPAYSRYWINLQRLPFSILKRKFWPFMMPRWLKQQLLSVDAVIAVGGDNYSLDYRIPSLIMSVDSLAMDLGKPVFLWGASVGPFDKEKDFLPVVRTHLSRMTRIFVREEISLAYLVESLKLSNVELMADPAFNLKAELYSDLSMFFNNTDDCTGVLGLNVSPLIERYKTEGQDLVGEVVAFIDKVVKDLNMRVLLIPHVSPLEGASNNDDYEYMVRILQKCAGRASHVKILPKEINAVQLKGVISKLRFFIGARTHATIAALSSSVPTVSIAYSVKAKGINKSIFREEDVVLPTPDVSLQNLWERMAWLSKNECELKIRLGERVPELKSLSRAASLRLKELL
jgi:colanic acid/amylovoran biosynthesis protein